MGIINLICDLHCSGYHEASSDSSRFPVAHFGSTSELMVWLTKCTITALSDGRAKTTFHYPCTFTFTSTGDSSRRRKLSFTRSPLSLVHIRQASTSIVSAFRSRHTNFECMLVRKSTSMAGKVEYLTLGWKRSHHVLVLRLRKTTRIFRSFATLLCSCDYISNQIRRLMRGPSIGSTHLSVNLVT